MAIVSFTFDPAHAEAFLRFGYAMYRDDPSWIPPLEEEVRAQLSPDFHFYRQPGNSHRHFMARAGSRVVGRVSAFINRDLADRDGTPVGCLGFFECVPERSIAEELIGGAVAWLNDRCIRRVWGPVNFDIWHGYRLLTDGFGEKRFYGEPYNKPYYAEFFEQCGFAPRARWTSVELPDEDTFLRLQQRGVKRSSLIEAHGYRLEPFDPQRFDDELLKLHRVLSSSFSGFLGFTPLPFSEFRRTTQSMCYALDPELFVFAHDESGGLCGFAGALLELSDAMRAMGGRSTFLAKARFTYYRSRTKQVMFHLLGVTPAEAHKRNGLGRVLVSRIMQGILARGYETCLATLMSEGNPSRALLQGAGIRERKYALFELLA